MTRLREMALGTRDSWLHQQASQYAGFECWCQFIEYLADVPNGTAILSVRQEVPSEHLDQLDAAIEFWNLTRRPDPNDPHLEAGPLKLVFQCWLHMKEAKALKEPIT